MRRIYLINKQINMPKLMLMIMFSIVGIISGFVFFSNILTPTHTDETFILKTLALGLTAIVFGVSCLCAWAFSVDIILTKGEKS